MSRIHFKNGIPSMFEIKKQFKKQTGLYLWIKADLNLLELTSENKDAVEILKTDIHKYEEFIRKGFEGDLETLRKESQQINHLSNFQLYNSQFYGIDFHVEENTIEMLYGALCFYFPTSLNKSLFDLGGRFVDSINAPTKGWELPKTWKKLKHWNEYRWYNRPMK